MSTAKWEIFCERKWVLTSNDNDDDDDDDDDDTKGSNLSMVLYE